MNKKLVGIALAFMLGIILIESYFLFVQPNQTVSDVENTADSTLHSPVPSSKNKSSTELPNATTSREGPETNSFTPAVPEFTVELVDSSYDVPTTYSTDPYTGKQVTHEGYHVAKRTIEVRIKNQPFKPYTDVRGGKLSSTTTFASKDIMSNGVVSLTMFTMTEKCRRSQIPNAR